MPWAFGGTRMALDHSLTHSTLINLFIKVRLNTLLLPPLLSITFVLTIKNCDKTFLKIILRLKKLLKSDNVSTLAERHYQVKIS